MTENEYLLSTYSLLSKYEAQVNNDTKALLLLLLWRLRQALIASLPDKGLSRRLLLSPLLYTFGLELQAYSDLYLSILLTQLEEVDALHAERAAEYAGLRLTLRDYKPRRGEALLGSTRSGGNTLLARFTPDEKTGLSPYTNSHLNAIRGRLLGALIREDATIEIARLIVAERTRSGIVQPINARGTIYSTLRNRDTALTSNAIWEVSGVAERAVFERKKYLTTQYPEFEGAPIYGERGWRWNAVLDPATCPVCRPLDGLIRQRITEFPYIPPVHPRCRCRILPIN